jgi:hypothetical protein
LAAVVEVDAAGGVEPIVDHRVGHRSRWFDEDPETTGRSPYQVKVEIESTPAFAVQVERLATTSRSTSTSSQGRSLP